MNESSTLVYLVHQIKTEMAKFRGFREGEPDEQVSPASNAPSALSVRKILDFAHVLQVEETESMGKVEWLLN